MTDQNNPINISTLVSFDTEYSADSVEWCPHKPNQNVFVCSNYYLSEPDESGFKKRFGRIMLVSMERGVLKINQIINTTGVLDQKWCHNKINDCSTLGIANSANRLEVYKLNEEKMEIQLISFIEIQNCDGDVLILSLDWSTGVQQSREPDIICSDSKGRIHIVKLVNNSLTILLTCQSHEFEAWISAFYYWNTNIYFSGGDDALFLKYDKRVGTQAVAKNRSHNAGVTSIHCNFFKENLLASGSYDESVRLWDMRNIKSEINSIKMPGTLWRLKWCPFNENYLLAACMLGGVHIVNVKNDTDMDICGSYYEHKNISYGADWCHLKGDLCKEVADDASAVLGTCSFYDHLLCISKFVYEM